jgi:hypothetical protein
VDRGCFGCELGIFISILWNRRGSLRELVPCRRRSFDTEKKVGDKISRKPQPWSLVTRLFVWVLARALFCFRSFYSFYRGSNSFSFTFWYFREAEFRQYKSDSIGSVQKWMPFKFEIYTLTEVVQNIFPTYIDPILPTSKLTTTNLFNATIRIICNNINSYDPSAVLSIFTTQTPTDTQQTTVQQQMHSPAVHRLVWLEPILLLLLQASLCRPRPGLGLDRGLTLPNRPPCSHKAILTTSEN